MMQRPENSHAHRSRNLLCGYLSGRAQSVDGSSLGHPHWSQSLEPSSFGEPAPTPTPATMASMLAPEMNLRMLYPMDPMAYGYYVDPRSMYNPNPPQFSGFHPVADNTSVVDAYNRLIPTYPPLDTSVDFGGMFPEPLAAHQPPPIPPAAPEQFIQPNPAFSYHSCRWMSGPQCDGLAPGRNREMGEHLRVYHGFVGHERDTVQCEWENCDQTMQRMNVPRHIVSRHLLAAASCRFCGKRFSRPDVVARHERTCSGVSPVSSSSVSRV